MLRQLLVAILLLNLYCTSYGQLLGGNLFPKEINKDTVEIQADVYYKCTSFPSIIDTLNLKIFATGSTAIDVSIMPISCTIDTIFTACDYCGCPDTNCLYPYILKQSFTYRFFSSQFGFQTICQINASFSPGKRERDFTFIDSANDTRLRLNCSIDLCQIDGYREYSFDLNPSFYAIKDQYYIQSQGFRQGFSNGFADIDSFNAQLAQPQNRSGKHIGFNKGFDYQNPLEFNGYPNTSNSFPRGFHLSPQTGDLRFSPSKEGKSLIKTSFNAFNDSGIVVISAEREFCLSVISNASEYVPYLSGRNNSSFLNGNNYQVYHCENENRKSIFKSNDLNKAGFSNIISQIPKELAPFITKNISRDTIDFLSNLDTLMLSTRPLRIFVELKDTICSIGSNTSYTILFFNNKKPKATANLSFSGNRTVSLGASLKDSFNAQNYRWRLNGDTFYVKDTSLQLKIPGIYNYELISYGLGGCIDTIKGVYTSPSFPYALISSVGNTVCERDSLSLNANYFNTSKTPDLFWNDQNVSATFNFVIVRDTIIVLKAVFNDGTVNYDSLEILALNNPKPELILPPNHCQGNEFIAKANYDTSLVNKKFGQKWTLNGKQISDSISSTISGEGNLNFTVFYQNGCMSSISNELEYSLNYNVGSYTNKSCPQKTLLLEINKQDSFGHEWFINDSLVHKGSSIYSYEKANKNDTLYVLTKYNDNNTTCIYLDTLKIEILSTTSIEVLGDTVFCSNDSLFDLLDTGFIRPTNGIWTENNQNPNGLVENRYFNPALLAPFKDEHFLEYTTTHPITSCKNNRTINFKVLPVIKPQFVTDSIGLCIGGTDILLNSSSYAIPSNGIWKGPGLYTTELGSIFSPSLVGVNSTNTLNYFFQGANGCTSSSEVIVTVNLKPNPIAKVRSGVAPISIYFEEERDISDCSVDEWFWDFYDNYATNCTLDVVVDTIEELFCRYSTAPTPVHRYRKSGIYPVKLVVRDSKTGIKDSIIKYNYIFLIANSTDEKMFSNVSLYPNPTSGIINISQNYDLPIKSYRVFSSIGQLLETGKIKDINHQVDLTNFKRQIIFIELIDLKGNSIFTKTVLLN